MAEISYPCPIIVLIISPETFALTACGFITTHVQLSNVAVVSVPPKYWDSMV